MGCVGIRQGILILDEGNGGLIVSDGREIVDIDTSR